jgi:transcriptional regulator with XRE-family HTH domain
MVADRIKTLMDTKGFSAMSFADKLGIQRSGLSHLFSGRNRPSLDLILKILETFPEVSPRWLLQGTGESGLLSGSNTITDVASISEKTVTAVVPGKVTDVNTENEMDVIAVNRLKETPLIRDEAPEPYGRTRLEEKSENNPDNRNERITVLYSDGTFRIYTQR